MAAYYFTRLAAKTAPTASASLISEMPPVDYP